MGNYEISTTDAKFLVDFRKRSEDKLSQKGINLCNRVNLTLEYYYESDINMTTDNTKGNPKFIHIIDKFLFEFNSLYKDNKEFVVDYCVVFYTSASKIMWEYKSSLFSQCLEIQTYFFCKWK